jgi:flagellar assembly factor FliW
VNRGGDGVRINTTNFGELEVDEQMKITFDNGLPGFENEHDFVILNNWDTQEPVPFMWLQSMSNEDLALVISIPFLLRSDYEFEIPESVCKDMNIADPKDVGVYTVCKIRENVENMTFNLASPIIVNTKDRKAMQLTLSGNEYTTIEPYSK